MGGCWLTIRYERVVGFDVRVMVGVAPDGDARSAPVGARACQLALSDRRTPGGDPQPPRLVSDHDCASDHDSPQLEATELFWMETAGWR